jgi:flagellar motor protein MotB
MEYLIMRKAITAVSITMLGASILIFISVMFVSRQREVAKMDSRTDARPEFLAFREKPVATRLPEKTRNLAVGKKPASAQQPKEKGSEQDKNAGTGKPAALPDPLPSVRTVSEPAAAKIDEKPPNSAKPKPAGTENSLPRHEPVRLLVLGEGAFSPGSVKPEAGADEAIDKIIPLIRERADDKIIIEGHADKSIPDGFTPKQAWKWNKIISMLRAKAIAEVLKQKGVAGDRIVVQGFGDAVPLASNLTRKGRSKNRRVEIKLSPNRR